MKEQSLPQNERLTVIFTHGGGRFGNQMFSYAHLLAFSLEHKKVNLINMACWEYSDLLAISKKEILCTDTLIGNRHLFFRSLYFFCRLFYIKNDSVAKNIIIHILYLFAGNPLAKFYKAQAIVVKRSWIEEKFLVAQKLPELDLSRSSSFDIINRAKMTVLSGWDICDWKLVSKHQKKIRSFLQIHQKYLDISHSYIIEKRKKYDFIIGVMIRQGDYQLWENGRYYFTVQQYSRWIDSIAEIIQDKGDIGFIIASDSQQDLSNFRNKNTHFTTGIAGSKGHYLESLSQLSLCDAVISPPSSFSMWATFLGDIPLVPLLQSDQIIQREQLLQNSWLDFVGIKEETDEQPN
jgi:Glycosyl transferase family 11